MHIVFDPIDHRYRQLTMACHYDKLSSFWLVYISLYRNWWNLRSPMFVHGWVLYQRVDYAIAWCQSMLASYQYFHKKIQDSFCTQDRRGHLKAPKFGQCCCQITEFYSSFSQLSVCRPRDYRGLCFAALIDLLFNENEFLLYSRQHITAVN